MTIADIIARHVEDGKSLREAARLAREEIERRKAGGEGKDSATKPPPYRVK